MAKGVISWVVVPIAVWSVVFVAAAPIGYVIRPLFRVWVMWMEYWLR